uniref:Ovo-like zinc finger 1a n=1 Tax=Gasterosteus aculeatus TaxID=69293 RepID=G3Q4P0_GASAC
MPRTFLVKKSNVSPGKRNWSEVPDHERGDVYVPVPLTFCDVKQQLHFCNVNIFPPPPQITTASLMPHATEMPVALTSTPEPVEAVSMVTRSTGQSQSLLTGMKGPTGAYVCHVCQKTFSYQRMLNRHLKCHNDTKRHLCSFCGKGFNDTFDLKRHVRTHTGVRPYKCTLCDKAFTQRCSLESHMKKIHSVTQKYAYKERRNKLYVCEECGLTAATQDALLLHLHSLHPDSALLKGKAARRAAGGGGGGGAEGEGSSPGSPQGADSDDTTGSAGQ